MPSAGPMRKVSGTQILACSPTMPINVPTIPQLAYTVNGQWSSFQFAPVSPTFLNKLVEEEWEGEEEVMFENEKWVVELSGLCAMCRKGNMIWTRKRWANEKISVSTTIGVDMTSLSSLEHKHKHQDQGLFHCPLFWKTLLKTYPTIPSKPPLFLGLLTFISNGAMTPIFSFLSSAYNINTINTSQHLRGDPSRHSCL